MNIKVLGTMLVTVAAAAAIFFVLPSETEEKRLPIDPANIVKSTINMKGMTCGHCEVAIEKIGENKGVAKIKAKSDDQKVEVEYDKTQTDIQTIMDAIEMKGFTPVSYEDENGLHEQKRAQEQIPEMKCGDGKCGAGKCGGK